MASLDGRVALVTGASRGVGRGVAAALFAAGATVYAAGRRIGAADLPGSVNAWKGYERMVDDGAFTWGKPVWEQPLWRWDAMLGAGVRAAFVASAHAARLMVPARRGLFTRGDL